MNGQKENGEKARGRQRNNIQGLHGELLENQQEAKEWGDLMLSTEAKRQKTRPGHGHVACLPFPPGIN